MFACGALLAGKGIRFTGMGRTGKGVRKNRGMNIDAAGDWPMEGHDLLHSGMADEVVETPLELLWKYTTGGGVDPSPNEKN